MENLPFEQEVELYNRALEEGRLLDALDIYEQSSHQSPYEGPKLLAKLYDRSRDFPWHKTTKELRPRLSAHADKLWEFFEANEHEYQFPRKIMKYAARLVTAQGASPESIERALRFIDTCELFADKHRPFDGWEFRAEALQSVAEVVDRETALRIHDVTFYEGMDVFKKMAAGEIRLYDERGYSQWDFTNPNNTLMVMRNAIQFGRRTGQEDAEKDRLFRELLDGPSIEQILGRDAGYKKSPELLQREVEAWRTHYGKFL